MKASKILAVRGAEAGPATTMMGIPVVQVPFAELNDGLGGGRQGRGPGRSPTAG